MWDNLQTETNILTDSEKKLLNALPWAAIVMDDQGRITDANDHWIHGQNQSNWLFTSSFNTNYFDHCAREVEKGNDYALRLIFSIREVLDGARQKSELTVICDGPSSKKWCKVSISLLQKRRPAALLIFTNVTSNMSALAALRESEEKYSKQFQYSVSGIIISSPEGEILDANPAACMLLGYSKQELLKGGRRLIVNPHSANPVEKTRQSGKDAYYEKEEEYIKKDGTLIPVEVISVSYRDGNGKTRVIYTFRDKSQEQKVLDTLEDERRFSQIILNNIPGIFLVIDKNLGLVQWNNMMSREIGYKSEELAGKNIIELFEESDKNWVHNVLHNIFKTGAGNFVANIYSRTSGIRPFHLFFNKFQKKDQVYLVATAVDKKDHIAAEADRERNFELMSQLFENSPLAMVMIETNGSVKKVNRGFIDLFGYKEKEIIGQNVNLLITSEEQRPEAEEINSNAFKGESHQMKTVRQNKQNEPIPVILNTLPIIHEKKVIAVFGIYHARS